MYLENGSVVNIGSKVDVNDVEVAWWKATCGLRDVVLGLPVHPMHFTSFTASCRITEPHSLCCGLISRCCGLPIKYCAIMKVCCQPLKAKRSLHYLGASYGGFNGVDSYAQI